jgi:hypothetical protein
MNKYLDLMTILSVVFVWVNVLLIYILNLYKIKKTVLKELPATMNHDGFIYWSYCGISFKGKMMFNGFHVKVLYDPTKALTLCEPFFMNDLVINNHKYIEYTLKHLVKLNVKNNLTLKLINSLKKQ